MALIEGITTAEIAEVGVALSKPTHIQSTPTPYGLLGHYAYGASTGTQPAGGAANSELVQLRWPDATRFAGIYSVVLTGGRSLTGFTVGGGNFSLCIARNWTVDGTGGNLVDLTGNNQKLRTSMGTSLVGNAVNARFADSLGPLGAGTKTFDAQPIGRYDKLFPAAANSNLFERVVLFQRDPTVEHPILLAQNEGIVVRATVPATGTYRIEATIKWFEVAAF